MERGLAIHAASLRSRAAHGCDAWTAVCDDLRTAPVRAQFSDGLSAFSMVITSSGTAPWIESHAEALESIHKDNHVGDPAAFRASSVSAPVRIDNLKLKAPS